ncbi:hypothetical protein IJT93_00230 [bacterium]|nr:hypothetical protein [bacterium]
MGEKLLKAPESDEAREYVFKSLLKEITDSGFSQEAAGAVLRSFALALGWNIQAADKGNGGPNTLQSHSDQDSGAPWGGEERVPSGGSGVAPGNSGMPNLNAGAPAGGKTGKILLAVFIAGIIALLPLIGLAPDMSNEPAALPVQPAAEKSAHSEKKAADKPVKPPGKSAADSVSKSAAAASLRAAYAYKQAGEYFDFGRYPQRADGKERPITWLVLRRYSDCLLVISKFGLDAKPYNERYCDVTWSDCTLRRWLNGEFLQKAFNESEQSLIKISSLPNNASPSTEDPVFLLSIDEAKRLFSDNEKRMAKPTAYAIKNGAHADKYNGSAMWWLRSHVESGCLANHVDYGGCISRGISVNIDDVTVRPAFRISLKNQ